MNLRLLIRSILRESRQYSDQLETYHGEHEAPTSEEGPMYDLTGYYPDDIYSSDGARLYGDQEHPDMDQEAIGIIRSAKGRPNKSIRIYRAVPNVNHELDKEVSELWSLLAYKQKFPFFPMGDNIARQMTDTNFKAGMSYDDAVAKTQVDIEDRVAELQKQRQKNAGINPGDWVTIVRKYAVQHGNDNLLGKHKIITKVVKASELFTDANSIQEWGYNPK